MVGPLKVTLLDLGSYPQKAAAQVLISDERLRDK